MSQPSSSETTWAIVCHLAPLATVVLLGNIILPLVLMLTVGKDSDFVRRTATEVLNFQITMLIYWVVAFLLTFVLIGLVLFIALAIFQIVVMILGILAAGRGEVYRYPLNIRFVKE
ncbi:MAG: hypothetical protein KatS3mg023_1003 [Armatimonadota bacterium]|nr:MAG: hypothetical protein KatS3mg023_1003 [Armatimonadota bacterium]